MIRKKIMVIGPRNCGKTTLANFLNDENKELRKSQDIIYGNNTIDVPSSFIESPWMHKHLITISQQASCILLLVDQKNPINVYPPNFSKVFRCPVIGIINKVDLIKENEIMCIKELQQTGINKPYYKISIPQNIGTRELKEVLLPYLK